MGRRVVGAALSVVGVLMVLFAPAWGVTSCPSCIAIEIGHNPACGCHTVITALAVPINWPAGWDKLLFPMAFIGITLVATGVVLLAKGARFQALPFGRLGAADEGRSDDSESKTAAPQEISRTAETLRHGLADSTDTIGT